MGNDDHKTTETRRFTLAAKLSLVTILMILAVTGGLMTIGYQIQANRVTEQYYQRAEVAAWSVAEVIDSERAYYLLSCIESEEFEKIHEEAVRANDETIITDWLKSIPGIHYSEDDFYRIMEDPEFSDEQKESISLYDDYRSINDNLLVVMKDSEITYAYMQYIKDGDFYTLVDPDLGVFSMGEKDEVVPELLQYTSHYQHIPSTVYQCSYGWLCTAYEPLSLPETGEMFALAGIDIGMNQIYKERHLFLVNSIALVLLLSGICIFINLYLIRNIAVLPLTRLTDAAKGFGRGKDEYTLDDVIEVDIRSNDEISDLYQTIRGMQTRMVQYTDDMKALTAEKSRVFTELQLAANIQTAMLQNEWPAFPDRHEFSLHASMDPAREVGGDFYDFFLIDEDHLALCIADVSGKGIPASLVMMSSMILLRTAAGNRGTPAEILTTVNDQICRNNKAKMFVTVWMGILDLRNGVMTCSSAGHEYPVLRGGDGVYRIFKDKHGFVIGGMEGMEYTDYEITLAPGDILFVYTDGVPETNNEKEEFYGTDRLTGVLNEAGSSEPKDILDAVSKSVVDFRGSAEQFDDMTMLCIRYDGGSSEKAGGNSDK